MSSAALAAARSRDPRLVKMRNDFNGTSAQGHSVKGEQHISSFPIAQTSSLRGLPRIPKHSKSSTRDDRPNEDPRKRRDKDNEEKSSTSSHRSSSKSSSKSSPSKKSSHESSRKRDDDKKSKSNHKSSRLHATNSKSPTKSSDDTPKDIDLRVLTGDIDMRPDSTTAAAAAESKLNKNKLLNELLHDEDMRSSQDSMISTSNDNGKELKIEIKLFAMRLSLCHNKFCYSPELLIYYDGNKKRCDRQKLELRRKDYQIFSVI